MQIDFTEEAEAKLGEIAENTAIAYIEILRMLHAAGASDLDNHEPFAVVNEEFYVYGVKAWRCRFEVLVVVDTADWRVGRVVDYLPSTRWGLLSSRRSVHEKDALARAAVSALGTAVAEVRVL